MKQNHTEERVRRLADLIGEAKDEYIEAASPSKTGHTARLSGIEPTSRLPKRMHAAATAAACILLMMTSALLLPRLLGKADATASDTATGAAPTDSHSDSSYTTYAAEALQSTVTAAQPELPVEETVLGNSAADSAVIETEAAEAGEVEEAAPTWDEAMEKDLSAEPSDKVMAEAIEEPVPDIDMPEPDPFIPTRSYFEMTLLTPETYPLWSWEDMTDHERYSLFSLDGELYNAVAKPISSVYRDTERGTGTALGHDAADGYREYRKEMTAFSIKGIADSRYIAVYMEEEQQDYIFRKAVTAPPETLGALIDAYSMEEYLTVNFWRADSEHHYAISREMQQSLWAAYDAYADIPYVKDAYDRKADAITFYASSEVCGFENHGIFTVTADGYIHVNAFDSVYSYFIGADSIQSIFNMLRENSPETEAPTGISDDIIIGAVTAITDHGDGIYTLTVDDTAACRNPDSGLIFTVPLTRITETRYIKHGHIRVGDTVLLTYSRAIPRDTCSIDSVTAIREVKIADKHIYIEN